MPEAKVIVRAVGTALAAGLALAWSSTAWTSDATFGTVNQSLHGQFVPRPAVNEPRRGNLRLTSVLAPGGEPFPGTRFTVLREQPDAYGKMRATVMALAGPKAFADIDVSPDRYRVQARNGAVAVEQEIVVPESGLDAEIVLDAGEARLTAVMDASGNTAEQAWFRVLRPDTDSYSRPQEVQVASDGYAESATFVLPSGTYIAEARYGDADVRHEFTLEAGARRDIELHLNAGRVTLTTVLGDTGELPGEVNYTLYRRSAEMGSNWTEAASAAATQGVTFVLPAGDYRAVARLDQVVVETDLSVAAGGDQVVDLPIAAGELLVYATLAGRDDALLDSTFEVVDEPATDEADAPKAVRGPGNLARFVLPAGEHRIVARHGESLGTATVTVEPGSRQTVGIPLDAGRVSMSLLAGPSATEQPYTWFSVYRIELDAAGRERRRRVYNDGYYAATDIVLPAGRYVAFARTDRHAGETGFEITPGSVAKVTIDAAAR